MDTIARTPQETMASPELRAQSSHADTTTKIEPPFTDYHSQNGKPFVVDYFQLGNTWDQSVGGFVKEVSFLEKYFDDQIKSGVMANNTEAVKDAIKKMEKVNGLEKFDTPMKRIQILSSYVEFLMKTNKFKISPHEDALP